MLNVIDSPGAVTPEWMTRALQQSGDLTRGRVVSLTCDIIGTGKMGDNARFTLAYDQSGTGAPATVVGKFPASEASTRKMAGEQGAYYNEVMFYRHLAGRTEMRTPRIYASEISADRQTFTLIMEDLAPASPGSQLVPATLDQVRQVAAEAARLATAFYGDASLAGYDVVQSPLSDGGGAIAQAYLQQCWPGFLARFGDALSDECREFGSYYVQHHNAFATRFQGPRTLAHGDLRAENVLFGDDRCCAIDWQTMVEASPLTDLAYFMGSSVDVDDRRRWEREVVAAYGGLLDDSGVQLDEEQCWSQYREQSMHGLTLTILGASFTAPDPRGDAMFRAVIQRQLQHCVDI